jgi:sulfate permease, SulP family
MPAWLFASLRGYRIEWLAGDLIAGMMLSAIAIPGQLATARLAGMPPETGLYAFAAGSLAFAAFGANRFMSVAADSTIAPIFASGLVSIAAADSANYAELATLLAVMVGIVLVAWSRFRCSIGKASG